MNHHVTAAIQAEYEVPPYIAAIANAVTDDLLNGPSWLLIPKGNVELINDDCVATFHEDLEAEEGDKIEQTYCGDAAATLSTWIEDLPSEVWVDADCGYLSTREPEAGEWADHEEVTGEPFDPDEDYADDYERDDNGRIWQENNNDSVWHVEHREIVEALFGRTIAREFY